MFFVLPTLVFKIRFLTASSRFLQVRQSAARKAKARDAGISCPSETLPVLSEGRNGMCLVSFFKTKNSCVSAVPMSDFQTARCLSLFFFFFCRVFKTSSCIYCWGEAACSAPCGSSLILFCSGGFFLSSRILGVFHRCHFKLYQIFSFYCT